MESVLKLKNVGDVTMTIAKNAYQSRNVQVVSSTIVKNANQWKNVEFVATPTAASAEVNVMIVAWTYVGIAYMIAPCSDFQDGIFSQESKKEKNYSPNPNHTLWIRFGVQGEIQRILQRYDLSIKSSNLSPLLFTLSFSLEGNDRIE